MRHHTVRPQSALTLMLLLVPTNRQRDLKEAFYRSSAWSRLVVLTAA